MSRQVDGTVQDLALREVLRDDQKRAVTERAWNYRGKASPGLRNELDRLLKKTFWPKGHRSTPGATKDIRPQEVLAAAQESDPLFNALLPIWVESQPNLRAAITEFLAKEEGPSGTADLHTDFTAPWRFSEAKAAAARFAAAHPEFNLDDAILMLCCLTGRLLVLDYASTPEDERAVQKTVTAAEAEKPMEVCELIWEPWLEELKRLPAEAFLWQEIDAFIQAVQAMTIQKQKELESAREPLRQALARLVNECQTTLAYFGLSDVSQWDAELCDLKLAGFVATRVDELRRSLGRYEEMSKQPAPTLADERRRREYLSQLENGILEIHRSLAAVLSPPVSPNEPPGQDDERASTTLEEEGREAGEKLTSEFPSATQPAATAEAEREEGTQQPSGDVLPAAQPEPTATAEEEREEAAEIELPAAVGVPPEEPAVAPETASSEAVAAPGSEHSTPAVTDVDFVEETQLPIPEPAVLAEEGTAEPVPGTEAPKVAAPDEERESESPDDQVPAPSADVTQIVSAVKALIIPRGSSHSIAASLAADDRDENWHGLFWAYVAEDDLPAAYWLAWSLAATGRPAPMPAAFVAATQGARWLSSDLVQFLTNVSEIAQNCHPSDDPQTMIGLAAALRLSLVAPFSGLTGWLHTPKNCPSLHELIAAVKEFTDYGIGLRREDLLGAAGAEQRQAAIADLVRTTQQWLAGAPEQRIKLKRASDVWRYLVGHKGTLRGLLLPVKNDRQDQVDEVRSQLQQWQESQYIDNQIDDADRELVGMKVRRIVGGARHQLTREIEQAGALAQRWCDLVEHEREIEKHGTWLFDQASRLRSRVSQALPEAEETLRQLACPDQPAAIAAASYCLQRALAQLRDDLNLPPPQPEIIPINHWEWLTAGTDSLMAALGRRLLLLHELPLEDNGTLSTTPGLVALALRDASAEERAARAAVEGWLKAQDYRFLDTLRLAVREDTDAVDLSRYCQEALSGSRAALTTNINDTLSDIEQAVVDGIIGEERSEYSADVVAIKPDEILNFSPRYEKLRQVREKIAAARQKRLLDLCQKWEGLETQLAGSNIEPAKQDQITRIVTNALQKEDTRVVEECLSYVSEAVDTGSDLEEGWLAPSDDLESAYLNAQSEFLRAMPVLEDALKDGLSPVLGAIRDRKDFSGLGFRRLPKDRLRSAEEAIEAWRGLKQRSGWEPDTIEQIEIVLRFLGFTAEAFPAITVEQRGDYWLYARAAMSASELLVRPIPQFGSQAQKCYDVVCVWDRPSVDTMNAWLHDLELDAQNVLVLFLGRMSGGHRRFVTRTRRERELTIAVLDELLLLFLAGEHRARLPVFFRCALPFTTVNPYTPFQAGDVPPEMFFGREGMSRELQRPAGACLVYGGRQLGKSALLRHVERSFDHPERDQHAWVEDIKLVGDPLAGQPTDIVWYKLRDGFKDRKLISARITTDKGDEIARYIEEAMDRKPECRVLVLFDEADNFLEADSKERFRIVEALRALMAATQRRFKVVFAGLQNVQRFQGIPNQPLAHFGTPICVGPLEPHAAQQLVRQPLEALGYRFADNATVLRILSYTNYHPGLIQLFCQELLKKRLHPRVENAMPPYRIDQADVEAIYKPEIRERIRERFDWTLALDMRYQAIAWSLIVAQMQIPDSYARAYPPGDILDLVRDNWSKGFENVTVEELRGILDEMRGLGVLVRNSDGHYRLRSPNLVRLMGTEADIEYRLLELSEKERVSSYDVDNQHAPLDKAARCYSPLTYSQARNLAPPQFGVGMICASKALGLDHLPNALKQFMPTGQGATVEPQEILLSASRGIALGDWLDSFLQEHAKSERLIVYQQPRGTDAKTLEDTIREALAFCQRHQGRNRWMRVLFLLDHRATWSWLCLPQAAREELENRVDAFVATKRWNLIGIRQRLVQHGKMDSDEVCQHILACTGGWPMLLDSLFDRCGTQDDPRPSADAIQNELKDPTSKLYQAFRTALGFAINDKSRCVLDFILRETHVPIDLVTPDMIGIEAALTAADCTITLDYLQRIGCLELRGDILSVEATVGQVAAPV